MNKIIPAILAVFLLSCAGSPEKADNYDLKNWPAGSTPNGLSPTAPLLKRRNLPAKAIHGRHASG